MTRIGQLLALLSFDLSAAVKTPTASILKRAYKGWMLCTYVVARYGLSSNNKEAKFRRRSQKARRTWMATPT